ncbi:MAG: hypothetical protein WA919_20815 [Coleofasciculaceae cyanobacterium]
MDKENLWSTISDVEAEVTKGGFSDIVALVEDVTFTKGDVTVTIDEITIFIGGESFPDFGLGGSTRPFVGSIPPSRAVYPLD